ncbi:hypothetical protein U1Q18_016699 [Sarracenia purpurea var. burkii]
MDPELNRYILLNEGKGLVPGYPQSTLDILGKRNIAAVNGSNHKRIRGSLQSLIGPAKIKDELLPKIDRYTRILLDNLDGKTIDIQKMTNDMVLFIDFKHVMEIESSSIYETFKAEIDKLIVGTLSLPINIPGTNYHHGFLGRKNVLKILRDIIEKRRNSSVKHNDMLAYLLKEEDSRYKLNDEELLDQLIMFLYSGYETVSTTSMMAIKYLHDHPTVLQELRDEHFAIQGRKKPEEPIDWNDYKSMSLTRAVILETQRLATVVNGVLRKTTEDLELNGMLRKLFAQINISGSFHVFLFGNSISLASYYPFSGFAIPRGWRIYVYTREINYDPFLYPEPLRFNPRRWLDKSMESHQYQFFFGGGSRLCPGKELGIVKIAIFLHYFVTRYR